MDETTFERMRSLWMKHKQAGVSNHWQSLKDAIPDEITDNSFNSKEFFEWFRDYDFSKSEPNWGWVDLFMALPYSIASKLEKIYRKLGITIYYGSYNRALNARDQK